MNRRDQRDHRRSCANPPDREDRDELWALLGRARPPAVSPFFARNVVREIRARHRRPPPWFAGARIWFPGRRPAAWAAAAAITLVLAFAFTFDWAPAPNLFRPAGDTPAVAGATSAATPATRTAPVTPDTLDAFDLDVIANLDLLLANEENSSWIASSPF